MTRKNTRNSCLLPGVVLLGSLAVAYDASSAATSYAYDALGRLVRVEISGGAQHGVRRSFQYDPAGNRTQSKVSSWIPTSITPASTTLSFMGQGDVVLTVNVGDTSAGGTVSFWFNDVFYGSAPVINGIASISFQGMNPGSYSVRATYSGDIFHEGNTVTFTAKVQDMSWLPAILDLILQ